MESEHRLTGACLRAACGGSARVYFERLVPEEEVVIFGAGHVVRLARRFPSAFSGPLGTSEEFANAENILWGRTIGCPTGMMMFETEC